MSEMFDKKGNQIRQNGLIMSIDEVVDLLNSQSKLISAYMYEFAKMNKENKKLKEENEQLRRYVYHCPQVCNKILKYLSKSETEDLKAINEAFGDDKYFDKEIDTLRSWE